MSTLAVRKAPPITVEQYEAFEGYPGLRDELIDGEIALSPQPKPFHQQVAKNIERLLEQALKGQSYIVRQNSNIKFRLAHSMPVARRLCGAAGRLEKRLRIGRVPE